MSRHWVLVGLMGAGKSTVGTLLAARAHRRFIDNDERLLALTGQTAAQIQADLGREALHRAERDALAAALSESEPSVIAGAASVVDDPATRELLRRSATVIWLDADVDELADRVVRQSHRPLGTDPRSLLEDQRQARATAFRDVADIIIPASGPPDELADDLLRRLSERADYS